MKLVVPLERRRVGLEKIVRLLIECFSNMQSATNDELLIINTLRILLVGDGRWYILEILKQLILQVPNETRRVMVNAEDSLL